jgi:hypothetical protein
MYGGFDWSVDIDIILRHQIYQLSEYEEYLSEDLSTEEVETVRFVSLQLFKIEFVILSKADTVISLIFVEV